MEGGAVAMSSRTRPDRGPAAVTARRAVTTLACLGAVLGGIVASCGVHQQADRTGGEQSAGRGSSSTLAAPPALAQPRPSSATPTSTSTTSAGRAPSSSTASSGGGPAGPRPAPRRAGGGSPAEPAPSPTPRSSATPAAAAVGAARAWAASDTDSDADPNATTRRAAAWLTPTLAAQVRAFHSAAAPGARWALWTAHRAYLRVQARLSGDDHPVDTATGAARAVLVTATPIGRDGWRGPVARFVVVVSLARTPAGWRAAAITTA